VDKGQDFEKLFKTLKEIKSEIFIIGKKKEIFINYANKHNIKYHLTSLQEAVKSIDKIHTKDSIALLSPACASFDEFENYKKRGEEFKKLVFSLSEV
jgi:UDP-N-acetylmuramoylalanine--D-glutamate ligase